MTSTLTGGERIGISAPDGKIDQTGTQMRAGDNGMQFFGNEHVIRASRERAIIEKATGSSYASVGIDNTQPAMITTTGTVAFNAHDMVLEGTHIPAKKITNNVDGHLQLQSARDNSEIYSEISKRGRFFGGRATRKQTEKQSIVRPVEITAEEIESIGSETIELEGAIIKHADIHITKDLIEKTSHNEYHTHVESSRRGWFAPKIKGDPLADALQAIKHTVAKGDILPNTINAVTAGVQTVNHINTLAHLSAFPNPAWEVSKILLTRFTTGAIYSKLR